MWKRWLRGRAPWDLPSRETWRRVEQVHLVLAVGALVTTLAGSRPAQLAAGIGLLAWLTRQLDRQRRAASVALYLAKLSRREPRALSRRAGALALGERDPELRAMLLAFWAHAALRAGEIGDAAWVAKRLHTRGWTPRTWLTGPGRGAGPDAEQAAAGMVSALALAGSLDLAAAVLSEVEALELDPDALTLPRMLVRALEGDDAAVLDAWTGACVPAPDQAAACWLAGRAQLRTSRAPYRLGHAAREAPEWLRGAWPEGA